MTTGGERQPILNAVCIILQTVCFEITDTSARQLSETGDDFFVLKISHSIRHTVKNL